MMFGRYSNRKEEEEGGLCFSRVFTLVSRVFCLVRRLARGCPSLLLCVSALSAIDGAHFFGW